MLSTLCMGRNELWTIYCSLLLKWFNSTFGGKFAPSFSWGGSSQWHDYTKTLKIKPWSAIITQHKQLCVKPLWVTANMRIEVSDLACRSAIQPFKHSLPKPPSFHSLDMHIWGLSLNLSTLLKRWLRWLPNWDGLETDGSSKNLVSFPFTVIWVSNSKTTFHVF